MPKGISLHLGLNYLSPYSHSYRNRSLPLLKTSENDAKAMGELAKVEGFEKINLLLTREATLHNFEKLFFELEKDLKSGDLFLLTFSGNGLAIPDSLEYSDDGQTCTWCLYDRLLPDFELAEYMKKIRKGVRVVIVSDADGAMLPKIAFDEVDRDVRWNNISSRYSYDNERMIRASIVCYNAAHPAYETYVDEGSELSNFTRDLLAIWNGGRYVGDYRAFLMKDVLYNSSNHRFMPHFFLAGLNSEIFLEQTPFKI